MKQKTKSPENRDPRLGELHRLWVKAIRSMPQSPRQREFIARHNALHKTLTAEGFKLPTATIGSA